MKKEISEMKANQLTDKEQSMFNGMYERAGHYKFLILLRQYEAGKIGKHDFLMKTLGHMQSRENRLLGTYVTKC